MAADDQVLDSEDTRTALELLVEAVAREIQPGALNLKLAASTLRDLLEDPSPRSYSLAVRAFDSIDGETRRRIQDSAEAAAVIYRTDKGRKVLVAEALSPRQTKRQSAGFLQALNFGASRPGRARDKE